MGTCGFAHGDGFDETAWGARKEGGGRVVAADHAEDGVVQPLSEENEGDHGGEGGEEIMQGGEERERDLRADDRSDEGDEGQAEIGGEVIACGQAVCCEDCDGGCGQERADEEGQGQAGGLRDQSAKEREHEEGGCLRDMRHLGLSGRLFSRGVPDWGISKTWLIQSACARGGLHPLAVAAHIVLNERCA